MRLLDCLVAKVKGSSLAANVATADPPTDTPLTWTRQCVAHRVPLLVCLHTIVDALACQCITGSHATATHALRYPGSIVTSTPQSLIGVAAATPLMSTFSDTFEVFSFGSAASASVASYFVVVLVLVFMLRWCVRASLSLHSC